MLLSKVWLKNSFFMLFSAIYRRKIVHFNVTYNPTAKWTTQQVTEAFPYDSAPKYLFRDRNRIYGDCFVQRVNKVGIKEVKIAPKSPWQNPYCERVIGSIRRECLDHFIIGCSFHST